MRRSPETESPIAVNGRYPYFAYGSNRDVQQMNSRLNDDFQGEGAILRGYKLVFNKYSKIRHHNVGNIVYTGKSHDVVEGAVFYLTPAQLEKLDKDEGLISKNGVSRDTSAKNYKGYRRERLPVIFNTTNLVIYVYIATVREPKNLPPSVEYLEHFLSGRKNSFLSQTYFNKLLQTEVKDEGGKQLKDHVKPEDYAPLQQRDPQTYLELCVQRGWQKRISPKLII